MVNGIGVHRSPAGSLADFELRLPGGLRDNVYRFLAQPVWGVTTEDFGPDTAARFRSISDPTGPYHTYRGSLSYVLQFAYVFDYRRIILYGVDLNTIDYFWTGREIGREAPGARNREDSSERQLSADETQGPGIHEYITFLDRQVFQPEDRRLYTASATSLLYPGIGLWREEETVGNR